MFRSLPFFLAFMLAAISLNAQTQPDLLLINGKIWTVNPAQKEAQAVALGGNRILAVGTNDEILKWKRPTSKVIDLHGHRVLPGFNDAHVHFYAGGSNLAGVQLRALKSPEAFRHAIAVFSKTIPPGQWILGGNWDHENWTPAKLPTRQLIDAVTPDHPVFVSRLDGHMALANSVALKMAGVDRNTKDVPGGVIVRDENGDPTGILKDAAQGLVEKVIPPPTEDEIIRAIRAAQDYAAANGVTSVQDMSAAPNIFRAYQTMLRNGNGNLHVRVSGHQPLMTWKRLADVGLLADFGNPFLHIGGLKGFADGSLGST
ncbi:MAG TPA: amidohydrolase family protein, partial [Bryobacteraceae bacterium]|nr:amidohydrolase family protein [Bryobacteraceae bacterium]